MNVMYGHDGSMLGYHGKLNMDDTGNSEDECSESSSGVFWRDFLIFISIFISISSDGEFWKAFWLLVRNLLLATFRLVHSEEFWYPRWIKPPSFPGTLSEIRVHEEHTLEHPEGRNMK